MVVQEDLQTRLQQMAFADRSFAGPFPYATNTPEKVFAGIEKPVPLAAVQEIISEGLVNGGGGGTSDAQIRRAVAPQLLCATDCSEQFFQCVVGGGGRLDGASLGQCKDSVLNKCMSKCV